jgi:methionine sulfoxide reductase heme-binding subunit
MYNEGDLTATASVSAGRTFGKDLRAAVPDAALALLLAGIVFGILLLRMRAGVDPALSEMPSMKQTGGIWSYTASQALGWAALAWSWITILLGVSLPIWSRTRRFGIREIAERLHRSTSLTVIGLVMAHAVLLLWDHMGDTLVTVFVPWTTSYLPGRFPQSLGIISFYLVVLVGPSFYFRDRLGRRTWRLLHRYIIPAVYILAVWHTFLYGSDVRMHNPLWVSLWILQAPIVAAFAARVLISRPSPLPRKAGERVG